MHQLMLARRVAPLLVSGVMALGACLLDAELSIAPGSGGTPTGAGSRSEGRAPPRPPPPPTFTWPPGAMPLPAAAPDASIDALDASAESSDASLDPLDASPPFVDAKDPSAGCARGAPLAGNERRTLQVGPSDRRYDRLVPEGLSGPVPLLIALHGSSMTSVSMANATGLSALAQREGFIVAYPQGLGAPASWNAGACCSPDEPERPDLELIDRVIDELEAELCIDRARVYVAGFSSGGMLAYRLACERADRIAAVATVAGAMATPLESCRPSRPVSLLHVHGTADPIVPFAGGVGSSWLVPLGAVPPAFAPAGAHIARFVRLNGCSGRAETVFRQADTTCTRHAECADESVVQTCRVEGGGHAWPGGDLAGISTLFVGPQSATLPTSELLWSFLLQHRLPAQ